VDEHNIVIRPLVTEQSMHLAGKIGAYSFVVNKQANKVQIKRAIENLYGVNVDRVRTMNRQGKWRRRGRSFGKTASWKKAVVYLKGEDHIDLF